MLDRLMGTETEYAILYGSEHAVHPVGRDVVFDMIVAAVRDQVSVTAAPGLMNLARKRVFTSNGGAIYYEHQPRWPEAGLVEGATPECRGPGDLLRYQRAQERLLAKAVEQVQDGLADGMHIGLRKNARDSDGNIYGPQESYEAVIASGWRLWVWRLAVVCLVPWVFVAALLLWGLMLGMIVAVVLSAIWATAMTLGADERALEAWQQRASVVAQEVMETASHIVLGPMFITLSLLVRALAWRPQRRALEAFLASRCIVSGAGSLQPDGTLVLCEKVYGLVRTIRWSAHAEDRAMFEIGHLMKALSEPMWLRPARLGELLRSRQRLQLSLSDSNRCDVAEYLKLATTALVIDMAERGLLHDAPTPKDAMAAARAISDDPSLLVAVDLAHGPPQTALQLQRFYHRKAVDFVEGQTVASLPAVELVALWGEVLDLLERDPDELVGTLDWVSKRALLDRSIDETPEVRKRIDLGYHDLVGGFHETLMHAGLVRQLVSDDEVEHAIHTPPSDSPAGLRGRLVQQGATRVDWGRARLGGKVIRLDRFRRDRDS